MSLTATTRMEPWRTPGKKGPVAEEEPTTDVVAGFELRALAEGTGRENHVKPEATARNEQEDHIREDPRPL